MSNLNDTANIKLADASTPPPYQAPWNSGAQNQYNQDSATSTAAAKTLAADKAQYSSEFQSICASMGGGVEAAYMALMILMSGPGLNSEQDAVNNSSSQIQVNTDLGNLINEMQTGTNTALTWDGGASGTGYAGKVAENVGPDSTPGTAIIPDATGMNVNTAQNIIVLWNNAYDDVYAQLQVDPNNASLQSMMSALQSINTQVTTMENQTGFNTLDPNSTGTVFTGLALPADGSGSLWSMELNLTGALNTTVANYNGTTSGTTPTSTTPTDESGVLSQLDSGFTTLEQTTGSLSSGLQATTSFIMQQIQTISAFVQNGFEEITNLNTTFINNEISS